MSKIPFLRRPRFAASFVLVICFFLVAHTTELTLRIGAFVIALGEMIRLWADGYVGHRKVNWTPPSPDTQKVGHLITGGPYAFVRHPLYLGSFLIGLGFCILAGNFWLAAIASAAFLLIYGKKIAEEEEVLHHEWGERFERYRASVPRLFPTGKRFSHREGHWNWQGIAASQEWKTVLWVAVGVIVFYLREELIQEGEFFKKTLPRHLFWAVVLAVLILVTGLLELKKSLRSRPNC